MRPFLYLKITKLTIKGVKYDTQCYGIVYITIIVDA